MKVLARLLLLIFGLSVVGYVLLDGGHELLHTLKTSFHKHEVAEHHHGHQHKHHHIEDHKEIFAPDNDQEPSKKTSVQISYFFFYFQQPIEYVVTLAVSEDFKRCLFNKYIDFSIAPLTPPPLAVSIV